MALNALEFPPRRLFVSGEIAKVRANDEGVP